MWQGRIVAVMVAQTLLLQPALFRDALNPSFGERAAGAKIGWSPEVELPPDKGPRE
jgi:hypothetical protein